MFKLYGVVEAVVEDGTIEVRTRRRGVNPQHAVDVGPRSSPDGRINLLLSDSAMAELRDKVVAYCHEKGIV